METNSPFLLLKGFSSVSQLSERVGYWVVPKHREPAGNCPSALGESNVIASTSFKA